MRIFFFFFGGGGSGVVVGVQLAIFGDGEGRGGPPVLQILTQFQIRV